MKGVQNFEKEFRQLKAEAEKALEHEELLRPFLRGLLKMIVGAEEAEEIAIAYSAVRAYVVNWPKIFENNPYRVRFET